MQILIIIALVAITFLPIVFWGYTFSYIDNSSLNRKRFIVGIIAGMISVFPILYIDKLNSFLDIKYLDISSFVSKLSGNFDIVNTTLSLLVFLALFILLSLFLQIISGKASKINRTYIRNIAIFTIFTFVLSLSFFVIDLLFSNFPALDFSMSDELYLGGVLVNSFKLIVFYYLIVAFLEETSKYFSFLGTSFFSVDTIRKGVLYSIFVALGFSFMENILYLLQIYNQEGLSSILIKTYFFRSIFSIILHVLCSSVLTFSISRAIIEGKDRRLSLAYIKLFAVGLFFSILLHSTFDIFLTLGLSVMIIFYLIGGYLYVSSIFYRGNRGA